MSTTTTEQDLIFIHFWRFPIQPSMGVIREVEVFSTIDGPVIHDWEIRVGPDTFGAFRATGIRNRHVQLRLRPAMFRDHIAEATKCIFQMKVRDRQTGQGNSRYRMHCHMLSHSKTALLPELLTPEPYTVAPPANERAQGFRVPSTSDIGTTLVQLYQVAAYAGRLCEITTTITIPQSQFRVTEWDMLPPPTPLHLDWRFRLLDDRFVFFVSCIATVQLLLWYTTYWTRTY
ncbi:hypothetical protein ANCCAN_26987 [Ancylostoma caninum]|uniref:Uncharacterized protein n=1 Tax=Ancylostoma caninum TaxID=29170 RepID=A0A368F8M6_ANCCA|nr:hypothetical protein ANCCAN_26987 [Ancylostoma caninum]